MSVSATSRVIYPGAISAPTQHETARAVVRVLTDPSGKGARKNAPTKDFITEDELKKVAEIVKRQQSGEAMAGLANVPELRRADSMERITDLNRFLRRPIVAETDRAGYSAILIDAFWSPEHRAVATLIAEKFGTLPSKVRVDAGAIERATLLLDDPKSLLNELPAAADIPDFDQRLREIRDFMDTGRSGLCNHGPVNIYGENFEQVFRLPFLPAYPPPPVGPPDEERNPALYRILDDTITEYEERFKETGYDRVYIAGQDGRLYVAVRASGRIPEVARGSEATFTSKSLNDVSAIGPGVAPDSISLLRNSGRPAQIGTVLRVIDVPNNAKEAATTYGRNLLLNSVRATQKQANEAQPLVAVRNGPPGIVPSRLGGQQKEDGIWEQLKRVGFLASFAAIPGLAGVTGGYFTGQGIGTWAAVVGLATAVTAIGTIGSQIIEQWVTPRNAVAFLSASGMTSLRKKVRADDI